MYTCRVHGKRYMLVVAGAGFAVLDGQPNGRTLGPSFHHVCAAILFILVLCRQHGINL